VQEWHGSGEASSERIAPRPKDDRATHRIGPLRKNLRMHNEGKSGIKDPGTRWQRRPRIEKMLDEICRGKIVKQVVELPTGYGK
jgi:hypothetical protein